MKDNKTFTCTYCNNEYTELPTLVDHITIHHSPSHYTLTTA